MEPSIVSNLYCNYEPQYVEICGTRHGLLELVKALLQGKGSRLVGLSIREDQYFKHQVSGIEVNVEEGPVKATASGNVVRLSGGKDSLAAIAFSIRNLAASPQSVPGSHMHFEPESDECMAGDSWSVVAQLEAG